MSTFKFPLLVCALTLSTAAHAQPKDTVKDIFAAVNAEECRLDGENAELSVKARQQGVPLSKLLKLTKGGPKSSTAITMRAYELPVYGVPQRDRKTQTDFRAEVELECFKRIR